MNVEVTIELGALSGPLADQLKGRATPESLDHLNRDKEAITRLLIRGYLTRAQADKARTTLIRKIKQAITPV